MHSYFEALQVRSVVGATSGGGAGGAIGGATAGAARFQLIEVRLSSLANQLPALPGRVLRAGLESARRATEAFSKNLPQRGTADDSAPAATEALDLCRAGLSAGADGHVRTATYIAGNCAQWTSGGMAFAGLLRRSRLFPKAILIQLLESEFAHGRRHNAHVVVYKHITHAPPYLPNYRFREPAYVHPLSPVRNWVYRDMHAFADVLVEVAPGSVVAVARRVAEEHVRRPPAWMPAWRGLVLGAPSLVLVGLVGSIGPLGPAGAAVWLGLNWWLF